MTVLELSPRSTWPTESAAAPIVATESQESSGRPVWMFGFPEGFDEGKWEEGDTLGPMGKGWIEIRIKSTGGPVGRGFSGGVAWDRDKKIVLGMIVASFSEGATASYMTPVSTMIKAFPEIFRTESEEIRYYREKAKKEYAHLPLAGFRTRLHVPIRIEDLYVPLWAMIHLRPTGEGCYIDAEDAEEKLGGCPVISLPEAFQQCAKLNRRGIVILGDPGSGKTTHLKRLLLWCLQGGLRKLGLPERILPVFLPLRELKNFDLGLDAFIQEHLDKLQRHADKGFGKRMLERGDLLFLFDGLDEVSEPEHRGRVSRSIERAFKDHHSCYFVITSRFAGYSPEVRLGEHFLEMHLRPFTAEQAEKFIQNWYSIVESGSSLDLEQAKIAATKHSKDLIASLSAPEFRARRVFEMTRNPLLLANICLVHKDGGELPKSRARLYQECTEILLQFWRRAISVPDEKPGKGESLTALLKRLRPRRDAPTKLTARAGREVLQPAAYWLHQKEGRTRANATDLAPVIEPALKAAGVKHFAAGDFLKAVRDESGLLTGWDHAHYGFMHLGFQEYLAACEIQSLCRKGYGVLRDLAARFGDPWWQEVILLLLALDNPSLFEPFMREVVKHSAFSAHSELVEMCLDDAVGKSPQPFVELLKMERRNDPDLWKRQLTALLVLDRMDRKELSLLLPVLRNHPDMDIQNWVLARYKQEFQDELTAGRGGYALVRIPGGSFFMGSPKSEEGRHDSEGPVHEATISDFYLGRYPVTNAEYGVFLSEEPKTKEPEYWGDRRFNQPSQPVVGVRWEEAGRYASWANLRLPSEAEWEYACRARTETPYYTGEKEEDLGRAGWYDRNSGDRLHPVGEKEPNAFGLYDMHGNVWEWVEDDWHDGYNGANDDGSAWVDKPRGSYRVIRGGAWSYDADACRSAFRYHAHLGDRSGVLGFRLARSLP